MNTRSALVAARDSHQGPWQRSQGNESGLVVTGLEEGGLVTLESEHQKQLQLPQIFTQDGEYDFPSPSTRWRIIKTAGPSPDETFVRVVLR